MKKFMIFLLMTFLYLGTCQARSEASYPKDASHKLLSWVTPTPSQSFLNRVADDATGAFDLTPAGPVYLGVTSNNTASFSLPSEGSLRTAGVLGSDETIVSADWKMDGVSKGAGLSFEATGLEVGEHSLVCEITTSASNTISSKAVTIVVNEENISVNIVGVEQACENDQVTLTCVIDGQVFGQTYQWFVDNEPIAGATGQTFSFVPATQFEEAIAAENFTHKFKVEVNRAGCVQTISPIHPFLIISTPVAQIEAPEFVCENESYTLTASIVSNSSIQPDQWAWYNSEEEDAEAYAKTTTNTLSLVANEENLGATWSVQAIFNQNSCNSEKATLEKAPQLYEAPESPITISAEPAEQESFCANSQITLNITDENEAGNVTYTWYVNGVAVQGVTGKTYVATFDQPGTYNVSATASYENYPCDVISTEEDLAINVEAAPALVITGNNVICVGQTATLTASIKDAEYVWAGPDAAAEEETSNVLEVTTAGVYSATATLDNGCTATAQYTVYQFGADVQIAASNMNVCPGEFVTLNANVQGWTNTNIAYAWDDNESTSPTIGVQIPEDASEPVTYTVTATATDAEGEAIDGCEIEQQIVINIITPSDYSITVSSEASTVCVGGQVTATVETDDEIEGYIWYLNGVEIPGEHLSEITMALNNAGTYVFSATPANVVCAAITPESSDEITVVAMPSVTITGNNVICQNAEATMTAVINASEEPNAEYLWSGPDSDVADAIESEVTTTVPGVYSVLVSLLDDEDAEISGCEASAQFTITQLGGDLQVYASDLKVCPGATVTLNANLNGFNNQIVKYEWSTEVGELSAEEGSTVALTLEDESAEVTVKAYAAQQDGDNEEDFSDACVIESTINIEVIDTTAIELVVNADKEAMCQGGQVGLKAQPADENVTVNYYVWYMNGVEIPGQNLDSIVVSINEPGEYQFAVRPADVNCFAQPATLLEKPVVVYAIPEMHITGADVICQGDTAVLAPIITPAEGEFEFAWSNGVTDSIMKTDVAGVYTVVATNQESGCVVSASFSVYTIGGDLHVSADKYEVCEEELVVLTANIDGYNNQNIKYAWSANGSALDTTSTLQVNPTETTTYVVTAIAGKCTMSDSVTVNVIKVTEGEIELEATVEELCAGAQTTISVVDGEGLFVWYMNGVEMPGENLPSITMNMNTPGEYTFSATPAANKCAPSTSDPVEKTIIVYSQPTVQITGDPLICVDSTVSLFAMINDTLGDNEYNFEWRLYNYTLVDGDNAPEFTEDNIAVKYENEDENLTTTLAAQDHPYIFTTKITTEHGCVAVSDPYYVYVGENPTVAVTVDYDTVCKGGLVTATAHLGNYNMDNLVYQWYENDSLIPHGTSPVYSSVVEETTIFKVVVKQTTTGCEATGQDTTFVVNPKNIDKIVVINNGDTARNICEGAQLEIAAYFQDEEGNSYVDSSLTYVWTLNGMQLQTVHGPMFSSQAYIYDGDPVDYVYTAYVVYDAPGCELVPIASDTIHVRRNPIVTIDGTPNVCYFNENDYNITLTAWVDGIQDTNATYKWYESGQLRPNVAGYDNKYRASWPATYLNPWIFTVEVENGDGCTAISEPFYVNVYDAPVVNITADADTVCLGGSVTLNANLDNYNDPMLTYQWYINQIDENHALAGYTHEQEIITPTESANYIARVTHLMYSGTQSQHIINQACWSADTFRINVNAIPQVVSITNNIPEENEVCDGYQVNLTANVEGGVVGGEVFTWYRNGEVIAEANNAEYTEVLSAQNSEPTTYTYAVSVKQAADGCESPIFTMNSFVVNPNPVLELTTDPIVCIAEENNVVLVANLFPAPQTDVKFNWFEDNVLIAENAGDTLRLTKPYRDYPYNFNVQLVNEYACTAEGSASVYVNAAPVVNITATETNICEGGEITLTASLNDWNADQLTFQWMDNDEVIPGATSLTYTVVPAIGEHNYSVKINQLTSECEATSTPIKVTVDSIPVITSVTVNNYAVCVGSQLTITANLDDTVEGEVFTWYRNGILMQGATGRVITDSPELVDNNTQQFTYTAVVTRPAAGCTSLATTSNTVTVYANPTVVITGDQHVCETDSVFLIANVDTVGLNAGLLHYTWYESGQIRDNMAYNLGDNQFFAEYMYARTEPYRFTVEVTRDNVATGCVSRSEVYEVYVYPQPVVNITATETEICENGQVTLTANLNDNNATDIVYQWYKLVENQNIIATGYNADGSYKYDTVTVVSRENIPGATSANFTVSLTETTTFGVMVLQTPSTCTANDEITINVNPIPVVTNVTVNGKANDVVCDGAQVTVAAEIEPANAAGAVYTWYKNGQLIEGATEAVYSENVYTNDNQVTTNSYTAIVTLPASGCVSTMSTMAAVVTVNPAPSTVTISGNNVICFGDQTVLTAYSDVPGQFIWSNNVMDTNKVTVSAGTYTVTLKTAEGCEMTSAPFTVESFGTDLLVSASETSICQGEHTTLYVNQDGWNGNVTYQWDAQAGNSTATTVDVTPDTTTIYTVTATVNNENGSCSAVGTVKIVVNPRPAIVEVTATAEEVCEGSQVTFNASGNASSYIWYENGIEIPGENQATLTLMFNEEGTYSIAAKAVSEEGCVSAQASEPVVVKVNAAPESVVITGQTVICEGGSTTLYANVTPNVDAVYTWYKDNTIVANTQDNQLVVTEAGSYKVEATVNGCTTVSDAVIVTVEQAPQLQLTATETTICVGGETVITAEATGWNNANVIYTWNNGYQGSAYTFVPTAAGTYKFIVTASQSTSGCVAVDSIIINVNDVPAAPQIVVDNAVICDGGQVQISASNAVPGATYTWYANGVVIPGATQATIYQSPVTVDGDVTTYAYTAIASLPASGCVSNMTANATVVTVIPTPVVAVSVTGNTTICEGGTTTLNANVTPAGVDYNYQWYQDNVLIPNATNASYVVSAAARETAYNYSVVVSANAGCNVTANAPAITVVADPVVVASVSDDVTCVGGQATFTVTVDGGVANINGLNGYSFAWYNNLSTTEPIATTPSYTTTGNEAAGNYSYWVEVTSPYGCHTISNIVNHVVASDPTVAIAVAQGYPTTICDGGQTTLIANVSGGHGEASYQWYKNGLPLYGETNPTIVTSALNYGEAAAYTVVVKQTGVGCETVSEAYNVNVVPAYTVDINGFGNVCEGGTLTLTATVNNVITGDVLSYQWYKVANGNVTPINGANAAQYSTSDLLLGDSYEYYVVVTSGISGCSVISSSVPANVVAAPSVAIQGANTVCEGGALTLNAFVTGGVDGASYTYTWNWTGAANGSATTAVPTFVPELTASDASTPYYFTVTVSRNDNTGCTATSAAHEVNVLAVPSVVVTADNNTICQNGEVTFTAHVSPVGAYNYAWTINGQSQAVNSSSVTTTLATTGTISATVVVSAANASASCSSTATIAVPVQVVAAPVVTISANHTTMCVGGTTTLTANVNASSNIPSEFNYQWAINGIEVEGAVASTFVQPLNAAGVYTYTLKVSQNNNLGCTSTWSAPVTVQVAEQPVVSLSSLDGLAICEGGSITMTGVVDNYGNTVNGVTNSNIYGAMTFDWISNGINVHHNTNISNASNQVTETLNNVGNYSYQVVVTPSGYNCQPQASNIEVVNVVSNPSWTDVHVYSNNGTDACIGETVTLAAAIQGGVSDYAGSTNGYIQWVVTDENGNTINVLGGLGGNSYDIPAAPGTYIYTPTFVGNIGSGCQLTNTEDVQVAVTVHELPTAVFASGDGTSLCANDPSASAELVINFTGVAPFNYQVVDNYGNVIAQAVTLANTVSIYVAPSTQTTYFINMVQDAYCVNNSLDANASATVYINEIEFENNFFVSGCSDEGQVTINFNVVSGNPNANFTVTYENGLTGNGTIVNNTATFVAPTVPGDYNAVFTVDGCSYDIVVRVLVGEYGFGGTLPIMDQRWNDVVVVNNNPETNGGHTFVGFQWYKNGVAIPGATYSNYQDKDGLNGFYSVELIEQDANGNMVTFQTCETYFNSVSSVKVYPVPANVHQDITIELDLTSEELEGAVLDIYSVTGAHISHVTDLQPITKIQGFKAQGTYFGRILTGTNEIKTVKFVIVK